MRNTYNTKIHFNYTIQPKGSNLFPMPAIPSFPPDWNILTFILWHKHIQPFYTSQLNGKKCGWWLQTNIVGLSLSPCIFLVQLELYMLSSANWDSILFLGVSNNLYSCSILSLLLWVFVLVTALIFPSVSFLNPTAGKLANEDQN